MLAGPDGLKAHKGDLHGQDQTDDVEGAVGWRREKTGNQELLSRKQPLPPLQRSSFHICSTEEEKVQAGSHRLSYGAEEERGRASGDVRGRKGWRGTESRSRVELAQSQLQA